MIHLVNKVNSKLATIMVAFDAGSRLESGNGYNPGISHMLEHCIFKGTETRNWHDINRGIAFLGGSANAFTSHEMVAYYITVPYENVDGAMEILSDIVFRSTIPDEEFLKEKEVVKEEEISRLDDVDSFIWNKFSSKFFSTYISNPVIGTQDSIDKFTRDEVFSFYNKFCKRDNAVVSFSSCLGVRESKRLLTKHFGRSSKKNIRNYDEDQVTTYSESKMELCRPGIEHSYVWLAYPALKLGSEKTASIKILSTILGGGMDSRLFSEVREKRGLAYGVGSSVMQWEKDSLFLIDSSTREHNIEEMVETVDDEILKIKNNPPSEEEVQRAKNKIRTSIYGLLESSYGIAYSSIKENIFNIPSVDAMSSMIENVTASDITEVAREVFDNSKRTLVVCKSE